MLNFQIDIITNILDDFAINIVNNYPLNSKFGHDKLTPIVCDLIINKEFDSSFEDIIFFVNYFDNKIKQNKQEILNNK